MNSAITDQSNGPSLVSRIWKRFGIAAFLFFLVKGLLWLAAPTIFYLFA